jgi:hypothetical protein
MKSDIKHTYMDENNFQIWKETEFSNASYDELFMSSLSHNKEGLSIVLRELEGNKRVKIFFEDFISYKHTIPTFLDRKVSELDDKFLGQIMLEVFNSSEVKVLHQYSFNIYKDWEIKHFVILTGEDWIDIVSGVEPKVEWL